MIYSRAAPGIARPEGGPALDEEHWSYMDRFADDMVARGPTLGPDRDTWTGSMHVVDLPSAGAAEEFVEREPYNRAGAYAQHLIRRFENLLGRTMWDFRGRPDEPRFLAIARSSPDLAPGARERLIVHGELLTPDGARPAGAVLALQAPTREAVDSLIPVEGLEVHDWEFGGRR